MVQAIGKNVLYMAMTALTIYLKLSINYIKLLVLRYAQFTNCRLLVRFSHPSRYTLPHALLESKAEGTIAPVTAVNGQLLGSG